MTDLRDPADETGPRPSTRMQDRGSVWHYTTARGLIGIVEKRRLWASSSLAMNDTSELTYGESILREAFAELTSVDDFTAEVMNEDLRAVAEASCFLVCATSRPDSLTQWRHYAGAQGYAIEIDTAHRLVAVGDRAADGLRDTAKVNVFNGWFHVMYDREAQLAAARGFLDAVKLTGQFGMPKPGGIRFAQGWLLTVMAQCKHPAFEDEREVRYIASDAYTENVEQFRIGPRGIIPYIELAESDDAEQILTTNAPKDRLPILSVTCGPSADPEPAKRAVTRLLRANGYDGVTVDGSDVPYRY